MLYLDYAAVVDNPRAEAQRIAKFLGRNLDVEAMAKAVQSSLYRNRALTAAHA